MPELTFRLVTVLKPEMGAKLKWAQRHTQSSRSFTDFVHRGPLRKAEGVNCDLYRLKDCRGLRGDELVIGKQFQAGWVEFDSVFLKLCQKFEPVHAADANGSACICQVKFKHLVTMRGL